MDRKRRQQDRQPQQTQGTRAPRTPKTQVSIRISEIPAGAAADAGELGASSASISSRRCLVLRFAELSLTTTDELWQASYPSVSRLEKVYVSALVPTTRHELWQARCNGNSMLGMDHLRCVWVSLSLSSMAHHL